MEIPKQIVSFSGVQFNKTYLYSFTKENVKFIIPIELSEFVQNAEERYLIFNSKNKSMPGKLTLSFSEHSFNDYQHDMYESDDLIPICLVEDYEEWVEIKKGGFY